MIFCWFNFSISYFYLSLVHVDYVNYHVVIFMAHLHLNELSLICNMWLNKLTYLLTYQELSTTRPPITSSLLWVRFTIQRLLPSCVKRARSLESDTITRTLYSRPLAVTYHISRDWANNKRNRQIWDRRVNMATNNHRGEGSALSFNLCSQGFSLKN